MSGKRTGKFARIFVEGYHLTTDLNAITGLGSAYNPVEVNGYTEDMGYLNGRADSTLTLNGFFNNSTGRTHDALKALAGTQSVVSVALGENALPTVGDPAAGFISTQSSYLVNPDLNGAIAVTAEYKARGYPVDWGVLLTDATVTSDSNGTSVDQSAGTTAGGVGYLHILGLSSGDTIQVAIQHSTDNAAWSDLIVFTLDGSAIDGERIEVTGTVNRYIRAEWDVTGASISFPIAVLFRRY